MISMLEASQHAPREDPSVRRPDSDQCRRQFTAARRELGAFILAVNELNGPAAVANAANYWIELTKTGDLPATPCSRHWRRVTIQAASRLAMDYEATISDASFDQSAISAPMTKLRQR
jgi:hypothetical protein